MAALTIKSRLIWFFALFSLLSIVLISYLKNSLELEDAEQAYYSQWWRWGYDDQPPLYTWLQKLVNSIFGVTKLSFSLLRGLLFASILLLLSRFGKKVLGQIKKGEMVMLASVLVPVFIDFAFRRLSHTLLACAIVLATCLIIAKLIDRKSTLNYFLLGLCLGVGMLAKYNYALFPAALFIASFFDGEIKKLVWNKKIVLSCTVVLVLFSPHLYWLLGEGYLFEIRESLRTKLAGDDSGILILGPILKMCKALFEGMLPLLLLTVILFFLRKKQWTIHPKLKSLLHLGISQTMVLAALFMLTDAQEVHGRWLLPLLLPYLVLFVAFLGEIKSGYIKWGSIAFGLVLIFQVVRTPLEKLLGIQSDIHFEFTELHQKLRKDFPTEAWVLPNVTYGGQIRLLNADREIYTLDDFSATISQKNNGYGVMDISKDNFLQSPLDSLPAYGPDKDDLYFYKVESPLNIPFK